MNCPKIQELILTDYIDGEITEEKKREVEQHLLHCAGCREYAAAARKSAVEPFLVEKQVVPPEGLWARIEEKIINEQRDRRGFGEEFLSRLEFFSALPRPALVVTGVMLVLLIGGINQVWNHYQEAKKEQEQVNYLLALVDTSVDSAMNGEDGFGTSIEEYFL